MRLLRVVLAISLSAGCSAATPQSAPPPTITATASTEVQPTETSQPSQTYPLTDTQKKFIAAVRKNPPPSVDADDRDWDVVQLGRDFCGMGYTNETIYDGHGGNPPDVIGIARSKGTPFITSLEKNAVFYLCPKYIKTWKQGMTGFGSGDLVVGKDVKPGRYRTLAKGINGCYWERTTKGGHTIANQFVTFAASHVTVTILPTDGGFSSNEKCDFWVPA